MQDKMDEQKRIKFRNIMQQAEKESLELKRRQQVEERQIEEQFKKIMMDKFHEEEKLDQMN